MNRTLFGALCLGLLAAPATFAQTTPAPAQQARTTQTAQTTQARTATNPPTEWQRWRTNTTQRLTQLERDLQAHERAVASMRNADMRARAQADLPRMRETAQTLRRDLGAMASLEGTELMNRQRDFDRRLAETDAMLFEARLRGAATPAEYRRLVDARFGMYDGANMLAAVPEERRAEAALEAIRMRSRQDALRARSFGTTRAQQERFMAEREAHTRDLLAFDRDFRTMNDRMMYGTMHDGSMQHDRPMQQNGTMQQNRPMQNMPATGGQVQGGVSGVQGSAPHSPMQIGQTGQSEVSQERMDEANMPMDAPVQRGMTPVPTGDQDARTQQQGQSGTQTQPQTQQRQPMGQPPF